MVATNPLLGGSSRQHLLVLGPFYRGENEKERTTGNSNKPCRKVLTSRFDCSIDGAEAAASRPIAVI